MTLSLNFWEVGPELLLVPPPPNSRSACDSDKNFAWISSNVLWCFYQINGSRLLFHLPVFSRDMVHRGVVSLTLSNKNWTHLIVLGRLLTSILFSNIQSLHSVVSEGAEKQKTNLSIIDTQTNSNIPLLIRIRSVIIQLNSVQKKLINIE